MAVLFVDLDDFKTVNDSLGHAAGDELLRQVAKRLDGWVRSSDTVARLGGDEFAVLVEEPENPDEAQEIAARIHAGMEEPFAIDGHELFMRASVGIAPAESGSTAEDLMRNADTAMYAAKAGGQGPLGGVPGRRCTWRCSAGSSSAATCAGRWTTASCSCSTSRSSTSPTGRVLGAEALSRWNHPTHGRGAAGRLHPGGRGDRPDRPAGRLGAHRGLPPGPELAPGRETATRSTSA